MIFYKIELNKKIITNFKGKVSNTKEHAICFMDEKNIKGLKIVHRKGKCENINYQNK